MAEERKLVYPALFTFEEDAVLVEVPDLEILTEGKDLYDAIQMARDAIELVVASMEDFGDLVYLCNRKKEIRGVRMSF